uniref:Uncharacterized protein n=1 Tax=Staphylococcus aureus TaxID=1280 RepID=A0A224B4T7_STAAU|nr:hypothetical protein [Staphylococcus aureus]
MKTSQDTSAVRYDSYWSGVLLGMFLSLKTLYRKRTVIWPFYFYTIIRTLSKISLCFSRIFFKCSKNSIGPKQHRIRMNSPGNLVVNFRIIKAFNAAIKANLCVHNYLWFHIFQSSFLIVEYHNTLTAVCQQGI